MDISAALAQEWTTLQNNFERYEGGALIAKLTALVLFFAGWAMALEPWLVCLVLLVVWLQEGIFKTWQSRLGERLLQVERLIATDAALQGHPVPFQLHSAWLAQRKGGVALLLEYGASACRPTVAFPYAALVLLELVLFLLG